MKEGDVNEFKEKIHNGSIDTALILHSLRKDTDAAAAFSRQKKLGYQE